MLEFLREKAGSWVIKSILFLIAAIFAFMGIDIINAPRNRSIAVVNGDEISIDDFQHAYNAQMNRLRGQFGGQINEEMLKMMKLKERTLENLQTRMLMLQEAEKYGIIVGDKELSSEIAKMFKSPDGSFNTIFYRDTLQKNGLSVEQFENSQREQMILGKLQDIMTSGVKITEGELEEWYSWENAEVNLEYAAFDPSAFRNIEIKDDELAGYFEKNKDKYKTPVQMQVKYVKLGFDDYRTKTKVSKEEIADFYEENKNDFRLEQKAKARHILIKVDEKAGTEAVESAKKKAEGIVAEAKAGSDFASLADKYTEDPAGKGNGGYLGEFTRQKMEKPFSDAVFSMKPGEVSNPVKTDSGWHIIKLESVSPEFETPEKAEEKIRTRIISEKYKSLAYDDAEKINDAILKGDNLEQAAGTVNDVRVETSDLFNSIEGIKNDFSDTHAVTAAAFALNPGQISDIIETDAEIVILEAVQKVDSKDVVLDNVREKVREDFIKFRQDATAKEKAEALLAEIAKGADFRSKAEEYHVRMSETGSFKRNGIIPGDFGHAPELAKTGFELNDKKMVPENVLGIAGKYYVFKYKGKTLPDYKSMTEGKDSFKKRILKTKQEDFMDSWITDLKKNSKIEILQPKILE